MAEHAPFLNQLGHQRSVCRNDKTHSAADNAELAPNLFCTLHPVCIFTLLLIRPKIQEHYISVSLAAHAYKQGNLKYVACLVRTPFPIAFVRARLELGQAEAV